MEHATIERPINIIVMVSITHRAWVLDLRCMSAFLLQPKEKLCVPTLDEGCMKDILSSGIFNCITGSPLSFICMILSSIGLLHQRSESCEKTVNN